MNIYILTIGMRYQSIVDEVFRFMGVIVDEVFRFMGVIVDEVFRFMGVIVLFKS